MNEVLDMNKKMLLVHIAVLMIATGFGISLDLSAFLISYGVGIILSQAIVLILLSS